MLAMRFVLVFPMAEGETGGRKINPVATALPRACHQIRARALSPNIVLDVFFPIIACSPSRAAG